MRTRFKPIAAKNLPEPINLSPEEARAARNSFRAYIAAAILTSGITAFNLFTWYREGSTSPTTIATLVFTILTYVALWLSRQPKRVTLAATVIVLGLLITQSISIFLQEGSGILRGLLLFTINTFLTTYVLPPKGISRWIFINLMTSMGIVLVDIFLPITRPPLDSLAISNIAVAIAFSTIIMTILIAREFKTYPLRAKFVLSFLVITFIPMLTLGYANYKNNELTLTTNANSNLLNSAEQTASSLDDFIRTNINSIRSDAEIPQFATYLNLPTNSRPSSVAELQALELLRAFSSRDTKNISSYALLDTNGIDVLDSLPTEIGKNKSTRSYFQRTLNSGQALATSVEFPSDSNNSYIYFSAPIRNSTNNIIGVLRVRYNASVIQQIALKYNGDSGERSFAIVFDENRLRLAHGLDASLIYKTVTPLDPSRIGALTAARRLPVTSPDKLSTNIPELEAAIINIDREKLLKVPLVALENKIGAGALAKMQTQPWVVAFFVPIEDYLAPLKTQTRNTAIIVSVLTLMIFTVSGLISQIIIGPITRLTEVARLVQAGDLATQAVVESTDEIGTLASTFNDTTTRLRELVGTLEQRVADRTKALTASAEVSRRLSTILDQTHLINTIVEEVQKAFNYYHVHIYLFDETKENLVMVGGTGEAGRLMLGRGHKIPDGRGVVGRAAKGGSTVLVPDTSLDPQWLPNILLPDTKSEIAVPIQVGKQILGALDVQHNVKHGLTADDAELLQSIANQMGVALQNAQSYSQTQRRVEVETMVNAINRKIQSTTSVETVLQTAAREIAQALGSQRTRVKIGNSKNITPHYPVDED